MKRNKKLKRKDSWKESYYKRLANAIIEHNLAAKLGRGFARIFGKIITHA